MKKGTLVFARQIEGVGTESTCVPEKMIFESGRRALRSAGLSFVTSKLVTQQNVVVTTTEKLALWNEYGAAGVDMETLPLIQVAEKANIRWLVLRAVIDTASMTLPETLSRSPGAGNNRAVEGEKFCLACWAESVESATFRGQAYAALDPLEPTLGIRQESGQIL